MAILEVHHIEKHFGATRVLEDISFDLEQGQALAIIGSSGSGKTTLLRCLNFLEKPEQGTISVAGNLIFDAADPATQRESEIRKKRLHFGLVFQNFNLISRTNARKNVELPMMYAGIPQKKRTQRAEELLDLVGMADRMDHRPNELSGGQKQRVAIARAMANDPAIILADEPTGALDSKTGRMVMDLFHRLNREQGKTIVLITHNQELAAETSRVLTMRDGILYTGSERGAREDGTR